LAEILLPYSSYPYQGEKEIKRGKEFLNRVKVVDDDPSERVLRLKNGAKIQDQHKKIFGTGDKFKAITV
jgi:hypothetical protein